MNEVVKIQYILKGSLITTWYLWRRGGVFFCQHIEISKRNLAKLRDNSTMNISKVEIESKYEISPETHGKMKLGLKKLGKK